MISLCCAQVADWGCQLLQEVAQAAVLGCALVLLLRIFVRAFLEIAVKHQFE